MLVRTLPAPAAQVTLAIQATTVLYTVHNFRTVVELVFSHTGTKSIHSAIRSLSNPATIPTHRRVTGMDLTLLY
ncbi:hypothetical protein N7519_009073 [Penicillium mononematosum]|uniref:uncharacterized protein n=1 Tax=Penicillium mononematosum TaxID=268346 RepID=UPI002547D2CB|nr:uncharacterized protein N7519_009073 [Penicillium mononematosum]KAJ6178612.1 hypothetical protein N7519_009073 [Penicillium mononematosum]